MIWLTHLHSLNQRHFLYNLCVCFWFRWKPLFFVFLQKRVVANDDGVSNKRTVSFGSEGSPSRSERWIIMFNCFNIGLFDLCQPRKKKEVNILFGIGLFVIVFTQGNGENWFYLSIFFIHFIWLIKTWLYYITSQDEIKTH